MASSHVRLSRRVLDGARPGGSNPIVFFLPVPARGTRNLSLRQTGEPCVERRVIADYRSAQRRPRDRGAFELMCDEETEPHGVLP